MIFYQKLIFFKAFAILAFKNDSDPLEIIQKYDKIMSTNDKTDEENIEILKTMNEIFTMISKDKYENLVNFINLLSIKFPQWSEELDIHRIAILMAAFQHTDALDAIQLYISKYGLNTNIALKKIEILMTADYEANVAEIESLMSFIEIQLS